MSKKGQIAIFVIAAVIIIALVVAGFYFRDSIFSSKSSAEVKDVSDYVQTCLNDVSKQAVYAIGQQGGYFTVPKSSINYTIFPVPFYVYGGNNIVPKKEVVESGIQQYVESNFDKCVGNFSAIQTGGVSVKKSTTKATVLISQSGVNINLKVPITVTKGDSSNVVSDFKTVVSPVKIISILAAANEIAVSESSGSKTICLTCINTVAEKYDLNVSITDTQNTNEYVFTLIDSTSRFAGFDYEWNFAAKYNFANCVSAGSCLEALQ